MINIYLPEKGNYMIDLRINVYPYSDEANAPFLRCRPKGDDGMADADLDMSAQSLEDLVKELP